MFKVFAGTKSWCPHHPESMEELRLFSGLNVKLNRIDARQNVQRTLEPSQEQDCHATPSFALAE